MSLEELEKKLYGLDRKDKEEAVREVPKATEGKEQAVRTAWEQEAAQAAAPAKKMGTAMKALIGGSIAVLLAVGGVAYYYISEYYKTKDLVFEAQTLDSALIGRPFDVTVHVENRSNAVLRDGKIFLKLPEGVIGIGNETGKQTVEETIGDVPAGEAFDRTYSVAVVKDEQSTKKITANFSYLPQNINTRFEREQTLEVHVGQPAITLDFTTPQNVFSTENFDIGMRYRNIADMDFKNVTIKLIAPPKVALKSFSIKPEGGNATWKVESLAPQTEQTIAGKAAFEGTGQDFFELKSQVVISLNGEDFVINEKTANLGIAASPLSLEIVANNAANYVAKPGETITYTLKYRNNTEVGLNDAIVKVKLKGEMFDMGTVRSDGSFDSLTNTLTWNAAGVPALKLIDPGTEGTISFTVQTKATYPIKRMFDKNFVVRADAEINSPTVPYNVASDRTVGFANSQTKVGGDIVIGAEIARLPGTSLPQVNKPSKYTVTWSIVNYATDMRDIKVNSSLQPGVKWTGVVKSNSGAVPTYNDRTGEIAWAIDKIIATKGVLGTPTEATFQVEITPNITQVGGSIEVTKDTNLSAVDDFTGTSVSRQVKGLQVSGVMR